MRSLGRFQRHPKVIVKMMFQPSRSLWKLRKFFRTMFFLIDKGKTSFLMCSCFFILVLLIWSLLHIALIENKFPQQERKFWQFVTLLQSVGRLENERKELSVIVLVFKPIEDLWWSLGLSRQVGFYPIYNYFTQQHFLNRWLSIQYIIILPNSTFSTGGFLSNI